MAAIFLLSALLSQAQAGPLELDPYAGLTQGSPSGASQPASTGMGSTSRRAEMEANFRGRYLTVPKAFMNPFFFDPETDESANDLAQPRIQAYVVGAEYVLKMTPLNWIFYYEYFGNKMDEGYWDDREEPPQHDDGDWVRPSGLGMHVLGFNIANEVPLSDPNNDVWVSFLVGGGLGAGLTVGELETWHPGTNESATANADCQSDAPAYRRRELCPDSPDDSKSIPPVLPIIDLSASFRVNFASRANLRLDFGIHDLLYVGGAVGGVF